MHHRTEVSRTFVKDLQKDVDNKAGCKQSMSVFQNSN